MNHEAVWNYTAPHISLCAGPAGAPPHVHSCHVHSMYPAPHQLLPQQFAPCIQPHQGYGAFPTTPSPLSVSNQHFTHPHQHLAAQVKRFLCFSNLKGQYN